MKAHEEWMRLACQLAESTIGQTSSNPVVGAVVVKDGSLLGCGAHFQEGASRAEVYALQMAGAKAKGATLYVTLEPCDFIGESPLCTELIINSGIKDVYIGSSDPDVHISGKGIALLRDAGVIVIEGFLQAECTKLNEAYFHHRRTGKPFVTLKIASTLDGKIATLSGDSKWITGEASRAYVHQLRHQHNAILVGVGTVIADNPSLTTRMESGGRHPIRVVVDSRLSIPLESTLLNDNLAPTWVFTTDEGDYQKEKQLCNKGIKVISTGKGPRVNWEGVLTSLGERGILSLLVEGGGTINASLLQENCIQKVIAFIAPLLLGGKDSLTTIAGTNPIFLSEAKRLTEVEVKYFDKDICLIGYL